MEKLIEKSNLLISQQQMDFTRSVVSKIDWRDRLIGIMGARGTGKTTLLLQRLKTIFGVGNEGVYISLDDIYFTENRLYDLAVSFRQQGGKALFIDEVHKYPNWAREIKNIFDFDKEIQIVFTGSSVVDILRQNIDLSRRAIQYELPGMSFREYLEFEDFLHYPVISLSHLLQEHTSISAEISLRIKPLKYFSDYLVYGYYPFYRENPKTYHVRLQQMVNMIIENDMRFIEGFDISNSRKIYQLLYILATNVPFKPNVSKLSEKISLHRNTLVQYLHYLDKARLINMLNAAGKSISTLQKPDKIFLENTNLQAALAPENSDRGSQRESFFLNQLRNSGHQVSMPVSGDFLVDNTFTFEIGGKGKSMHQVKGTEKSYIAADEIEIGIGEKIPLWLFGFLY